MPSSRSHSVPLLRRLLPGAVAVAALAAGCGSAIPSSQGGPATVQLASGGPGAHLVDEAGHSLYVFEKDEGKESYCYGACASVWPPVETSGTPTAASGVSGSLGTIERDDGGRQLTYDGHPLYYYAGDGGKPGKTTGEELDQFGAAWYLVSRAGMPVESKSGADEGGGS